MIGGMGRLFASGHAADIVLAIMLVEALWLIVRRGWPTVDALTLLLPGALILMALRASLTHQDWPWIALPLMLSLPVHLADIARRRLGLPMERGGCYGVGTRAGT